MIQIGNKVNLIVCQKSKVQDWFNHLCEHYSGIRWSFQNLTNKLELEYFLEDTPEVTKVGVINYELAWRRKRLLQLEGFTLMLDESSLIQNQKAKQTKFILKMKPKNVILLSGTPTAGKYENLWSQINLLGWSISEHTYNNQYVNWTTIEAGGFRHKIVDKTDPYKNVERLKRKLREHGAVFMKTEEAFALPEQIEVPVVVPSSKEYRKFCKDKVLVLDGVELIGDTQLTERLHKRQLCGMYSREKLDAFRNLVESTNDRLIVFYNFNGELEKLKGILKSMNRPVSVVNGSEKDLTAYEQEDDSVTLIQYQAGAMGLNLQKANKIIYFTIPDKSELFEQSKKRIHRIGQEKTCFYYFLLVRNSVETNEVLPTLKVRKEWSDELFKSN
jgi:SNF2 family DNA or RNA helicase